MAKRTKSPAEIKAAMEALKAELREAEAREAERLGSLAVKAGLHEIDIDDAVLVSALKELAARFQSSSQLSNTTA
ncbi:TraC family protein [Aliirhizobium smilacinae]|uniref:Conjugal transfer protein n=1 Tax=Aliirhizobium smilacinae TaxID=1395944 RepID=A0A5C4X947_9HYPH|nr:TraC family protein [Rhizobium smilacinae]TNM59887.1 conjugal transfer protein [Rhizobium smilacinae]